MARRRSSPYCSFCGKAAAEVQKIIAGPGVYICDGCVATCNMILAVDDDSADSNVEDWQSASDEHLLAHLPRIAATAAQIEAALHARVAELRNRGVTWARIGDALSMTRQSAWERFAAPGTRRVGGCHA